MQFIGKSFKRIDAFDKVTGRAKYTDDLVTKDALVAHVLHSTIANGRVKSIDISEAEKVPGVVKIATCFDVPTHTFPTAGHPWSTDPGHQDIADRLLLTSRVRCYGDDIAAVIARDDISAKKALKKIAVEYEEYPAVLDQTEAMQDGVSQLHEDFPNNILKETFLNKPSKSYPSFEEAVKEPGLIRIEGWYETQTVKHCHIENPVSYAYMEKGRVIVVSSTQIPHITRRVIAQALGLPWGDVRVIKPYIGGGFGNKQDALYEPLNAWLTTLVGGRTVKLELQREEDFICTRVRHATKFHIVSYVRPNGKVVAREYECYSNNGAYASHGHSTTAKGVGAIAALYSDDIAIKAKAVTVFTNKPTAGAMRAYGIPQSTFAIESHTEDIAKQMGIDPIKMRELNMMKKGFHDPFFKYTNHYDSLGSVMAKAMERIGWSEKHELYSKPQTGPLRRGIGCAIFWYNTGVWPISLESSSCRMLMNQDGSVQLQMGETEIGQGADTVFAQMAAQCLGIPFDDVHIVSDQDTDITPFGTGAYASRQTYMASHSIHDCAMELKGKLLDYAAGMLGRSRHQLDTADGKLTEKSTGRVLMSLGELATTALYSMDYSKQFSAEVTRQIKSNALSMGCSFAEVEVDIPLGRVKVLDIINVHDCGTVINPQLAEAQVHGGMSMALGYALQEKMLFDAKGRPLNNNFLDYKLPTMMDHPELKVDFVEFPDPNSPFGNRSLGEPPTISAAPAIRNAVLQATGVSINELPLSPHVCFRRFKEEGLIRDGGEE